MAFRRSRTQDILIYCLLRFANRSVGGDQYDAVEGAIYRLTTLTLKTNLRGEETTYTELFGVVDRASMVRRHNRKDRPGALLGCSIVLSKWILEALEARRVLTLHNDYFRLKMPLERAVYQVVRKHCGGQRMWKIGLAKLQGKVGSSHRQPLREFRRQIRKVARRWRDQDFLDYAIEFDDDTDQLVGHYTGEPRRIPADLPARGPPPDAANRGDDAPQAPGPRSGPDGTTVAELDGQATGTAPQHPGSVSRFLRAICRTSHG